VEDVARSIALIRAAGVRSLNLDLIFGWPGQTRESWRADLERAVAVAPDHLSCYPLTLAHEPEEAVANWPGGGWPVLARWRARAQRAQPDDDMLATMYIDAERILSRAGFIHYEIANWALPGHRSRHNLVYWRGGEWLGVGAGAHSQIAGRRFWNSGRLPDYIASWERPAAGRPSDGAIAAEPGDPPHHDRASRSLDIAHTCAGAIAAEPGEAAMLSLRLREGLRFGAFARRYGAETAQEIRARLGALEGAGLLRWRRDGVSLTRRGRLLSNEVFVRLI
jgi:oxygen-independent coproporphyrinogen-3 oxidase